MDGRSPEAEFEAITHDLLSKAGVEGGTGFGSNPGLRVGGRIFAMLVRGSLVVKLPRERVDKIAAAGHGTHFDPGHGRLMREWVAVQPDLQHGWRALAEEAFEFAGGAESRNRRTRSKGG